jgi:EPS-associated MarR family transcriptional regulator
MPKQTDFDEDTHFKVLRLLDENPHINQRDLAKALGVSLGKTNYCIKALLDKGLLKMQNFQSSESKLAYAYILTPAGIVEKSAITSRFLKRKMIEYENLRVEIDLLRSEINVNMTNEKYEF